MRRAFLLFLSIALFQTFGFAQTPPVNPVSCPTISVTSSSLDRYLQGIFDFKAEVKDFDVSKLKFEWTVTNGEVDTGQGTLSIDVKPIEKCLEVTVTLRISGLPESCINEVNATSYIPCEPRTASIDSYEKISFSEEKTRLDKLVFELQNEPFATGFIVKSFTRNVSKARAYQNLQQILKYLELRGIAKERITFGLTYHTKEETNLWLIPSGIPQHESSDEILDAAKLAEKLKAVKVKSSKKLIKRKR